MELLIGLVVLVFVGYIIYVNNTSKSEAGVKVEQAEAAPVAVEPAKAVSVAEAAQPAPAKPAKKKAAAKTAAKKTAAKKTAKPKAK